MAGEQSSGTFVSVPGETQELKERFGAQVQRIKPLEYGRLRQVCRDPSRRAPRAGRTEYRRG